MNTKTALHYVDPSTVVWCPTISEWTGDDLATNTESGMQQCPECRALLDDADIEPAHHVEIGNQWHCGGEEASVVIAASLCDGCDRCGEYL